MIKHICWDTRCNYFLYACKFSSTILILHINNILLVRAICVGHARGCMQLAVSCNIWRRLPILRQKRDRTHKRGWLIHLLHHIIILILILGVHHQRKGTHFSVFLFCFPKHRAQLASTTLDTTALTGQTLGTRGLE